MNKEERQRLRVLSQKAFLCDLENADQLSSELSYDCGQAYKEFGLASPPRVILTLLNECDAMEKCAFQAQEMAKEIAAKLKESENQNKTLKRALEERFSDDDWPLEYCAVLILKDKLDIAEKERDELKFRIESLEK